MHVTFTPQDPSYRLYVRYDATVNGNGGGGAGNGGADSATVDDVDRPSGARLVRHEHGDERREPRLRAAGLRGARRSARGRVERPRRRARTTRSTRRTRTSTNGNVVQHARVLVDGNGAATLALGFGASQDEAVGDGRGLARHEVRQDARRLQEGLEALRRLAEQAAEQAQGPRQARPPTRSRDEYYLSANVLKASEDKTFPGAIVASLASPWGQAVSAGDPNNTYFGSYREVFGARPLRGVDGPASPTATARPRATRRSSSSSTSSFPTARCRATASSTARPRRTRSTRSSTSARTRS